MGIFANVARRLQRLAPRDSLLRDSDAVAVMDEAVAHVRAARGAIGGIARGLLECADFAIAALRARFGRPARITNSPRSHVPPPSRTPVMSHLFRDARSAVQSLLASPAHTALVVVTLALGVGINTTVFSVLDSILFRPVPFPEQQRLALMWTYYAPGKFAMAGGFTPPLLLEWRQQTDLFDRVEGSQLKTVIFEDDRGAEMVSGSVVTPGLLSMLGARPRAGRLFREGDGQDGTDRLVLVSERFWRDRLHGAPDAVGHEILLDGERHQVVGVLPATFRYPSEAQDLWMALDPSRPPARPADERASLVLLARAARGVPRHRIEEATMARGAELNRISGGDGKGSAQVMPLGHVYDDRMERSLLVLAGAVGFLLLIVCANVANLTMSRAMTRARDRAVRAALGASRAALIREALVEHVLLGAAGAVVGLGIAYAGIAAVSAVLPEAMTVSSLNRIDIDIRTLLFLGGAATLTVLLFGVAPAVMAGRSGIAGTLQNDSRSATGSATARRLRSALVVAEVAFSIVLLVGAALMTRSLLKLQAIDTGIRTDGLVTMRLGLPAGGYADAATRDAFTAALVHRLRTVPGVMAASAGDLPPEERMITLGALAFGDKPAETKRSMLAVFATWPGYFSTAGIRIIEGREPTDGDVPGATVVSAGFAARHWPGQSAVGRQFKVGAASWRTIVGVAAEVRKMSEDDDSKEFEVYYPRDQVSGVMTADRPASRIVETRTFLVRLDDSGPTLQQLAGVVHEVDSRVVISETAFVEHAFADAIARPRTVFLMMAVFAGVGLLLAAAGLYAVLSYLVAQRIREIGIRLALGARPKDIRRLVLGNGLGLAAIGLVLGVGAALGLVNVMRTLLYEVEATDPTSVIAVSLLLLATAAAASWRPARRAMRVDPVSLLRQT